MFLLLIEIMSHTPVTDSQKQSASADGNMAITKTKITTESFSFLTSV